MNICEEVKTKVHSLDDLLNQCSNQNISKLPKSLLRKPSNFSENEDEEALTILPAVTKSVDDDTKKLKPKHNTVKFFLNENNETKVDCHI